MSSGAMTFHHLGLATSSPERALHFLEAQGYAASERVVDELQNVKLILCTHADEPCVEIISPNESPGPLDKILEQQSANVYHVCYETESAEQAVARLDENGIRCITVSEPKPAILFGGQPVSFYFIHGFGLIELLETGG